MKQKTFIVFLILSLVLIAIGCQEKTERLSGKETSKVPEPQDVLDEKTEQKILTFSLSGYSEAGRKSWDLKGDSADILTSNVVLLENVLGHSYTKDNVITLTADKGEFDKNKNNLLLKENVVATTKDGARLNTDYLNWNATKEEVETDARVKITRENMEAIGQGAFGKPSLKQMQLKKDVTVSLKPTTTITCDGPLQVDTQNNIAIFNKNVVVNDERGKLWADMVKVFFNPQDKTIAKVLAIGNVKIVRGQNITYSEQASYDANSKLIILTGRPKLILYSKEDLNAFTSD
jgi:LPS export ABC transporter protein LptC